MPLAAGGETAVLDALLTGRFLSMHTGTPPGGEVPTAGTGYVRQPVSFVSTGGPDPTVYKNSVAVQFPAAVLDWGNVTHFGIWSAATGGTLIAYAPVATPKAVTANDVVRWEVNSLAVSTD
jgi:hypothetical protein